MKRIPLGVFILLMSLVLGCTSTAEEIHGNEDTGNDIVNVIAGYKQDHNQLPERLDLLLPNYLVSIPKTLSGEGFSYKLDRQEGYYLCFDVRRNQNLGCCYYGSSRFWDCGFGD